MKHALFLVLFVVSTVVCVAEDLDKNELPATVSPAVQYTNPPKPKTTSTTPQTTTTTPQTTTTTTTTPKTTTTTHNTTTTTPKTTTKKPKTTTTTPKTTTKKPKTTTTTPKTTTTTPKTTTTKPKTTTAKPKTTTTTPKTTTTTPKTTTTTPKTTTTTPKTTTTTPKTTTTTPKTTTTMVPPKPTPPATLTVGEYSTKRKDTSTCLLARMALQIRLVSKVNGTFIVQPNMTKSSGVCDGTTTLNISFVEGFIMFGFNKNSTGNSVYLDELSLSLFYPFSTPAEKYAQQNKSLHLFAARIGHAYSCRNDSIYMGNGLYLDVTQNQMQAFNFTQNNVFDVSDPCPADAPNYTAAIVVGVILLVLIIIVVVAYILGRRRRSGGYQPL